jgi:hypothetical protein
MEVYYWLVVHPSQQVGCNLVVFFRMAYVGLGARYKCGELTYIFIYML